MERRWYVDRTINTIRYDKDRGTLLLSCAGINTILELDLGPSRCSLLGSIWTRGLFWAPGYTGFPIFSGAVYDKPHGAV